MPGEHSTTKWYFQPLNVFSSDKSLLLGQAGLELVTITHSMGLLEPTHSAWSASPTPPATVLDVAMATMSDHNTLWTSAPNYKDLGLWETGRAKTEPPP